MTSRKNKRREPLVHLRLRLPEKLRFRIEAQAWLNNRSMNAEITSMIERAFYLINEAADASARAVIKHQHESESHAPAD